MLLGCSLWSMLSRLYVNLSSQQEWFHFSADTIKPIDTLALSLGLPFWTLIKRYTWTIWALIQYKYILPVKEIPLWRVRRSYDRLISTMGFLILVRRHLYIESGPWSQMSSRLLMICCWHRYCSDHSRYGFGLWKMSLQSHVVSHGPRP